MTTTTEIDLSAKTVRAVLIQVLADVRDNARVRKMMRKENRDFSGVLCILSMQGRVSFLEPVGTLPEEALEEYQRLTFDAASALRSFTPVAALSDAGFVRNQFGGAIRLSEDVLCFGGPISWLAGELVCALVALRLNLASRAELKAWFTGSENSLVPTDPKDPLYLF